MKYTIGIDVGTSGTKTVLFDSLGKKQASHTVEYPLYQPKNGWAEQDPADWKNAVFETVRTVMEKSGVDKNDVVGIGISGQMHGLVMLDKNDNILRSFDNLVRPENRRRMPRYRKHNRKSTPYRDNRKSRAYRLHRIKNHVGEEARAGDLRKMRPHPASKGLYQTYSHGRIRNGSVGRKRYAAS